MKALTLVLPYFENAGILREHFRLWSEMDPALTGRLNVIVVDDCSPDGKQAFPVCDQQLGEYGVGSFRLYRCDSKARWNWLFARNLGVAEARTDWVLLTDIDHALPADTLAYILSAKLERENVYRFSREDAPDRTPYHPHPNSWLMTRAMYDRIGGYDERFSGYYGTDADFRERVQATARAVVLLSHPLVRYPREVIADASTTTYGRKEQQDRENVARIRAERAQIPDWRPLRLTFPWSRLI